MRDVVTRLERTIGKPHLLTQVNVGILAAALQVAGQLGEAVRLQRETRALVVGQLGVDNPYSQVMRFNLADMLLDQGDATGAARELRDITPEVMQQGASTSDWQLRLDIQDARLLWLRGDKGQARTLLEAALPKLNGNSPDSTRIGASGRKLLTAI